jgi:kynurenine 3-monooxygenase
MNIIIVGAGPAGLFLAHQLLALNSSYTARIYDSNKNPTDSAYSDAKEFGLGLGARVRDWLISIDGLNKQLVSEGIEFTPNGLILITRRQLCAILTRSLLSHYESQVVNDRPRLSLNFNVSVVDVDLTRHEIAIARESGTEKVAYDLLVGADGIHSTVRSAMMVSKPNENNFQQQQRPHVWKVLQLPVQPELPPHPPRIIRLQKRNPKFGLVFGACLPRKDGSFSTLIFWQPTSNGDTTNPCGIATPEELQQLLHQMSPKNLPPLQLDQEQAMTFLATQPGREYWSQCRYYHDLEGQAVIIGDAAHGMFSLLGQGCSAAIADAVALNSLLAQYGDQLSVVLPKFSEQQVKEGHAASNLSLIALTFYHKWLGLLYRVVTLLWIVVLRKPSIFERVNQVDANYMQVLRENKLWVWLAQKLLPIS